MNCDQAFDHLTLTAPPADGHALAEHLAGCPRCRSLAETLEPALELFRAAAQADAEAISTNWPSGELPAWLFEEETAPTVDSRVCPQPASLPTTASRPIAWSERPIWQVVAAVLIGMAVGGTVWGVSVASQRDSLNTAVGLRQGWTTSALAVGQNQANELRSSWSKIRLSKSCLPQFVDHPLPTLAQRPAPPVLGEATLESLDCCTLCHAAGKSTPHSGDAGQIAMSCQACHQP